MYRTVTLSAIALLASSLAVTPDPVSPDPETLRPIESVETVFMEDMTWMEVRDAMRGGKDTVIVATGGVEQNGPYLVTGKHNFVLRGTTEAIARKLGNALVAPIVPFVPKGGRLHYIPEYYDFAVVTKWLEEQGIQQVPEGLHDDFGMTAMMMSIDPQSVRTKQRIAADNFRINGVNLAPAEQTIVWGSESLTSARTSQ